VVNTKSKGKKNVLVLSSVPPILAITKDDGKQKPAIIKFYDFSKGGTDIVDERIGYYSTNTKSRRWSMAAFEYILDTARINSQTVHALQNAMEPRKINSFEYGWDLAMSLIKPHIRNRSKIGLHSSTKAKINIILGEPVLQVHDHIDQRPILAPKKARCHMCLNNIRGQGYSKKFRALSKLSTLCGACGNCVCKLHMNKQIKCQQCV
jgi:hypothetical protein